MMSSNSDKFRNQPTRNIKIIRNEAGYGFTLSRYIIYHEDNNNNIKPTSHNGEINKNHAQPPLPRPPLKPQLSHKVSQ